MMMMMIMMTMVMMLMTLVVIQLVKGSRAAQKLPASDDFECVCVFGVFVNQQRT